MRLDRAATKLLALASTVGVIAALTVTSAAPALAATAGPASSGPRLQAIVSLAGNSAVSVPGVRVQSVLGAIHSEIVDGTAAELAQLASTPGVLGVEPNVAAHLESDSFGGNSNTAGHDAGGNSSDSNSGNGGSSAPTTTPSAC